MGDSGGLFSGPEFLHVDSKDSVLGASLQGSTEIAFGSMSGNENIGIAYGSGGWNVSPAHFNAQTLHVVANEFKAPADRENLGGTGIIRECEPHYGAMARDVSPGLGGSSNNEGGIVCLQSQSSPTLNESSDSVTGIKIRGREPQYVANTNRRVFQGLAPRRIRLQVQISGGPLLSTGNESSSDAEHNEGEEAVIEVSLNDHLLICACNTVFFFFFGLIECACNTLFLCFKRPPPHTHK